MTQRAVFVIEELTVGGAEQMLVAMANAFLARGHEVHLICLRAAGELAPRLSSDVTVHVLDKKPGIDFAMARRLRRLIRRLDPDAINAHLWVANLWTRIAALGLGMHIVVTEHSRDNWKSSHYRRIDRWLARGTQMLVAVSEDTADFYRNEVGIPHAQVQVINNGIDTQRYLSGNGAALREQWVSGKTVLVGTVGRMVAAKNHLRLIEVAAQLKARAVDVHFVIAGDGPERESIEHAICTHDVEETVTLLGARSDVPDILDALDLFVLSSDREGHPLTALEAQAAGTPVVLTEAGGSADAIARSDQQCGGLLVPKTADALATAIETLAHDSTRREAMAAFGQSYAQAHFGLDTMIDRYEAVLFFPRH